MYVHCVSLSLHARGRQVLYSADPLIAALLASGAQHYLEFKLVQARCTAFICQAPSACAACGTALFAQVWPVAQQASSAAWQCAGPHAEPLFLHYKTAMAYVSLYEHVSARRLHAAQRAAGAQLSACTAVFDVQHVTSASASCSSIWRIGHTACKSTPVNMHHITLA